MFIGFQIKLNALLTQLTGHFALKVFAKCGKSSRILFFWNVVTGTFFPSLMSLFFSSKINHSSSVSTVSSLSLPTVHQTRPLWHLSAMCCQLAKTSTLTTCDYSKAFSFTVTELLLNPGCVISELLTYPTGLAKKMCSDLTLGCLMIVPPFGFQ